MRKLKFVVYRLVSGLYEINGFLSFPGSFDDSIKFHKKELDEILTACIDTAKQYDLSLFDLDTDNLGNTDRKSLEHLYGNWIESLHDTMIDESIKDHNEELRELKIHRYEEEIENLIDKINCSE